MSELPKCDREVYERGEVVFVTHSLRSADVEMWVREIAATSGQRVDWHYAAGRALIKALGDISKVRDAIRELMPEHGAAFCKDYPRFQSDPPRPEWWMEGAQS